MLKSVNITGLSLAQSRSITIPLMNTGPSRSSFFIKKIVGLEPVKADIQTSSYANFDGELYQSSRVGGRDLAMAIALVPSFSAGESVQSLRRQLYRILPPKTPVRLTFNDDLMPQTFVDGRVEQVAPSIFDRTTDLQASIQCFSSYLSDTTIMKNVMYPMNTVNSVNYQGDAPAPVEITATFVRSVSSISFLLNGVAMLTFTYAFQIGDQLYISTKQGKKNAYVKRSGSTISLLDYITVGSLDLNIDAATDTFALNNSYGTPTTTDKFALTYTAQYLGI